MSTHPLRARSTVMIRSYVCGWHKAPVTVAHIPVKKLGRCIHVVERPAFPCPDCDSGGLLEVYAKAVRWSCGHTRSVPKLDIACYTGCYHNRHKRRLAAAA